MNDLIAKLKTANLIDDRGNIILESYPNGQIQCVDQETFNTFFGTTDYSYAQLIAADQGKGYTRFFNVWHGLGII